MINNRYHRNLIYKGQPIIIDACYISSKTIEIMVMYSSGTRSGVEIESKLTEDLDEAELMYNTFCRKYEEQEERELTGKYAKLRDDLKKAVEAGKAADQGEDGGTCNFDAPSISLPRWIEKKVKQAAKEAGTRAWKWDRWGGASFVFSTPTNAQANRNSRVSEAMCKVLTDCGYDVLEYSAMD